MEWSGSGSIGIISDPDPGCPKLTDPIPEHCAFLRSFSDPQSYFPLDTNLTLYPECWIYYENLRHQWATKATSGFTFFPNVFELFPGSIAKSSKILSVLFSLIVLKLPCARGCVQFLVGKGVKNNFWHAGGDSGNGHLQAWYCGLLPLTPSCTIRAQQPSFQEVQCCYHAAEVSFLDKI